MEIEEPRSSQSREEVQVEDIIDRPESSRDEEGVEVVEAGTSIVGKKRKILKRLYISLPFILDTVPTVEDMLGKVTKLSYADHDVCDTKKFLELDEE
jgi:hypothetical protein